MLSVDESGATGVPGVWAAGNVADPSQQVAQAAANGSWVGAMVSFDLAEEDVASGARPSAVESDWDGRYSGAQVWSGNPNGALVAEVAALEPGRALDLAARAELPEILPFTIRRVAAGDPEGAVRTLAGALARSEDPEQRVGVALRVALDQLREAEIVAGVHAHALGQLAAHRDLLFLVQEGDLYSVNTGGMRGNYP